MRLLIADDNQGKVRRIVQTLVEANVIDRDSIFVAYSAQTARTLLLEKSFDLMLLDILFPRRDGDADPDSSASLELLTELTETRRLIRPRHVVGITAYSGVADEVAERFRAKTWTVLVSDEMSDDWLGQIVALARYIQEESSQLELADYRTGVAVITALRTPEMAAIRKLPWNWQPEQPFDSSSFYSRGNFRCNGQDESVITTIAPRMGMVATSVLATKVINFFRPRLLVMAGICAGVRGSTELGDVVFATLSWDYQSGKHFVDSERIPGFSIEPYPIAPEPEVMSRVDQLATDVDYWVKVMKEAPVRSSRVPRLLSGPFGSGSAVLADSQVTDRVKLQQRKLLAIDMEAYGLFSAAESASIPKPKAIVMKGVSDFADSEKSDGMQPYAAYTSACAIKELLERYFVDLVR